MDQEREPIFIQPGPKYMIYPEHNLTYSRLPPNSHSTGCELAAYPILPTPAHSCPLLTTGAQSAVTGMGSGTERTRRSNSVKQGNKLASRGGSVQAAGKRRADDGVCMTAYSTPGLYRT